MQSTEQAHDAVFISYNCQELFVAVRRDPDVTRRHIENTTNKGVALRSTRLTP